MMIFPMIWIGLDPSSSAMCVQFGMIRTLYDLKTPWCPNPMVPRHAFCIPKMHGFFTKKWG